MSKTRVLDIFVLQPHPFDVSSAGSAQLLNLKRKTLDDISCQYMVCIAPQLGQANNSSCQ